jgi:hypothetical protein
MQGTTETRRDPWLTALAVAMGLMAVSNLSKPVTQHLSPESTAGFVLFGTRLRGAANAIVGPLFGLALAAYAYGVWGRRRWVVPLAAAYALYVIVNLAFFMLSGPDAGKPPLAFMMVYAAVAIGVSSGGAWYLARQRHRLS